MNGHVSVYDLEHLELWSRWDSRDKSLHDMDGLCLGRYVTEIEVFTT